MTETAIDRLRKPERAIVVTDDVLKELTDSQTPQGIVAEIAFQETRWTDIKKGRFLVLEDVQDPGNLGTMVRTADAANFDAVFYLRNLLICITKKHFVLCKAVTFIYQYLG